MRILFVDDEIRLLEGLKRMLRPMRLEWEMAFASSGKEALEILASSPFDVIVTDMRMPVMDGNQLLEAVKETHPEMVRIILSGYSDKEMILRSVQSAHQYIAKPCDAKSIHSAVARACALRALLKDESLIRLVSQIESLPSLPALYTEVMHEINSPDCSLQKVADIIARDVGMTAKILQLANSAFFGLHHHVNNPARAVSILGMDTIKALIMTIHIFSQFDRSIPPGLSMNDLWRHSMRSGVLAKTIAKVEGLDRTALEDAFMAGLLHDVGKLVLLANLSDRYATCFADARDTGRPLWKVEEEVLGTTHAQVGAYLMGLWGLPDPIVESIAFHHDPKRCLDRNFGTLTVVHVADAMDSMAPSPQRLEALPALDLAYLESLQLIDRLPVWADACELFRGQGEAHG